MKFQAKKIDMVMELTTINGEEVVLNIKESVTATYADKMMKKMEEYEKEKDVQASDAKGKIQLVCDELSMLYPERSPGWFKDKFDFGTLNDMLVTAVSQLLGLKKS